jgi:hypothetical protein
VYDHLGRYSRSSTFGTSSGLDVDEENWRAYFEREDVEVAHEHFCRTCLVRDWNALAEVLDAIVSAESWGGRLVMLFSP